MLEKQVDSALKTLKQAGKGAARHHLMERDLVVLFGLWRGWSNVSLARMLGVHPVSVARYQKRLTENPALMFKCPVLHKGLKGKKVLWTCGFCEQQMMGSERKAREHVASHVCSPEAIAIEGVMPKDV